MCLPSGDPMHRDGTRNPASMHYEVSDVYLASLFDRLPRRASWTIPELHGDVVASRRPLRLPRGRRRAVGRGAGVAALRRGRGAVAVTTGLSQRGTRIVEFVSGSVQMTDVAKGRRRRKAAECRRKVTQKRSTLSGAPFSYRRNSNYCLSYRSMSLVRCS